MNDELELQLRDISSPETAAVFMKLLDLLAETGVTTHLDTIEQNMGLTDYPTGGEYLNMLRDTLERQLTYELGIFGITLNPDVPYDMDFCTELLRSLYFMDSYQDPEALMSVLVSEEDARETLFKVVSVINALDEDEFFIQVKDVSPAIITRLQSLTEVLPDAISERVEELRGLVRSRTIAVRDSLLPFYEEFEGEITSEALAHVESVDLGYDIVPTVNLLVQRIFNQPIHEVIADLALLTAGSNIQAPSKAFDILINNYVPDEDIARHSRTINDVRDILESIEGA